MDGDGLPPLHLRRSRRPHVEDASYGRRTAQGIEYVRNRLHGKAMYTIRVDEVNMIYVNTKCDSPPMESMGERLRQARIKAGFGSARSAALKFGWTPSTYAAHENGQNEFDPEKAQVYAKAFKTSPAWLLTGENSEPKASEAVPSERKVVPIPVVGTVEAGIFREVTEFDDEEPELIFDERDPDFPRARMMAFRVRGDSMNAAEPPIWPGSKVICVDFEETGLPLTDGMTVVIERTLDGGLAREWSVKEIEYYEDRVEYHPRSSNPKHKPIVVPHETDPRDGSEVKVLGLVRRISHSVPVSRPKRR